MTPEEFEQASRSIDTLFSEGAITYASPSFGVLPKGQVDAAANRNQGDNEDSYSDAKDDLPLGVYHLDINKGVCDFKGSSLKRVGF